MESPRDLNTYPAQITLKVGDAMNISNDQHEYHSDDSALAEILRQNKNHILSLWESMARAKIPAARDKPNPALINSIPKFIDKMIETLASKYPFEKLKKEGKELAKDHGTERAHMKDYTIDQIIWEYNILRQVIFEVIDPTGDMTLKQGKMIWDSIFIAIKNAAARFSEIREGERLRLHEALEDSHKHLHSKYVEQKENLIETEVKYKSIINSIEDYAICTISNKGVITSWNSGAERMKGYSAEEAIGKDFSILYTSESILRNEPRSQLETARKEGRYRGEGLRTRKNGEKFIADAYIIPLKKNNEIMGFANITQDLTERNSLIQDRDLSVSETMGLRLEQQMRESFVSTLAHDLRSPLTAAKVSAQMIMRSVQDKDKIIHLTHKIVENISRTDKMISNLLDANRISAGEKIHLRFKECSLNKIAESVKEDLSPVYDDRIQVIADREIIGHWDDESLQRVIENLTTNALKYGDATTRVTITLQPVDSRVLIKVHNLGKIIKEDDQAKLFEPYKRIDCESNGSQGWGLGLTLVKGLVEAHNGIVKVESYPKEGTTFTVDLPIFSYDH